MGAGEETTKKDAARIGGGQAGEQEGQASEDRR